MHRLLRLAALSVLPAWAFAQDPGAPAPLPPATGTVLLVAAPARCDLLVHTPDLPALLASARAAGLGDGAAWHAAFRDQLRAWGGWSGDPDGLVKAGDALLANADGEVLLASMPLPAVGEERRSFVLALRTSARREELTKALKGVIASGLGDRYRGEVREESVEGRRVLALDGIHERLYVTAGDGLVAVSDHPLTLGLLLRGLARGIETGLAGEVKLGLLSVRHGPQQARWSGWMFGTRENLSWPGPAGGPVTARVAPMDPVVTFALHDMGDAPVLPVPAPTWVQGVGAKLTGGHDVPVAVSWLADGSFAAAAVGPDSPEDVRIAVDDPLAAGGFSVRLVDQNEAQAHLARAGGATRGGWLTALGAGRLEPLPGVDRRWLARASASAKGLDGAFVPWTAAEQPGEVSGPAWHGPATFLALRTLHYVAHGLGPGETAPPPPPPAPPTGAPDRRAVAPAAPRRWPLSAPFWSPSRCSWPHAERRPRRPLLRRPARHSRRGPSCAWTPTGTSRRAAHGAARRSIPDAA